MDNDEISASQLAVDSEAFKAALFEGPAPGEPAAPSEQPAPGDAPTTPPAPTGAGTTDSPAGGTPPEPAQEPDELATLRSRLAELEEREKRREGQYSSNTEQQREALRLAKERADEAERRLADEVRRRSEAAEADWNARVAEARRTIEAEGDPSRRELMQHNLRVAIQQHDAELKAAEAERKLAEASAKEARLAPVFDTLDGLQKGLQVRQHVEGALTTLADLGATQLAAEVGVPVEEVREYLAKPTIREGLARALAEAKVAEIEGRPVPRTFQDLGEQIRDRFVTVATLRREAEERLVAANQRALDESGATRRDGGGGGMASPREIKTMADVTTADWRKALFGG